MLKVMSRSSKLATILISCVISTGITITCGFRTSHFEKHFPCLSFSHDCSELVHGTTVLKAKAANKKKKARSNNSGGGSGLKGFGSPVGGTTTKDNQIKVDRSKKARCFYEYLEERSAGDNLNRCAIANMPMRMEPDTNNDIEVRGIAALKPIKKGDNIIRIPYGVAINLGEEGSDPTVPAVFFLKDYCQTLASSSLADERSKKGKAAYYEMLPPFRGDDCMSCIDFFSDRALKALQSPLVVEEIQKRKERITSRFQSDINIDGNKEFPNWIDGSPLTEDHLTWAVWIITSRVLTVEGNAEEGKSYRLLIPYLDMCNHDRKSKHILTGRAVSDGELKVVAGASVKKGDSINICYGGGVTGNDRFIQDYGFADSDEDAYNIVAQQLLGKRRIFKGVGSGYFMTESDRSRSLNELDQTTLDEDSHVLEKETDSNVIAAYSYRIGVKNALSKYRNTE